MSQTDILLESGTNEVEVAEFTLGGQRFGVNVAKVREFIPLKGVDVCHPPLVHPSVSGVFFLRGKNIPLISLDQHLGLNPPDENSWQVIVVTEFNNLTTAFITDQINMIHRVSWTRFKPLDLFMAQESSHVTGSIEIDGSEVLVLDLEHIIGEIFPESVINYDQTEEEDETVAGSRADVKIVFAEDSAIIRTKVSNILSAVGYGEVTSFTNGQDALNAIRSIKEKADSEEVGVEKYLTLLLTDIEMPQMDGLSLCRHVKKDLGLDIPVVMFSSLINEQMATKCRTVGADGFASKPETEKLIEIIDELSLGQGAAEG